MDIKYYTVSLTEESVNSSNIASGSQSSSQNLKRSHNEQKAGEQETLSNKRQHVMFLPKFSPSPPDVTIIQKDDSSLVLNINNDTTSTSSDNNNNDPLLDMITEAKRLTETVSKYFQAIKI